MTNLNNDNRNLGINNEEEIMMIKLNEKIELLMGAIKGELMEEVVDMVVVYTVGDKVVLSRKNSVKEEFRGKKAEIVDIGGAATWKGYNYTMKVEGHSEMEYGLYDNIDHDKTIALNIDILENNRLNLEKNYLDGMCSSRLTTNMHRLMGVIEGELMDAPVNTSLVEEYKERLADIEFQIIKLLDMEEEDDMYDYHYQVLQLALKSASEWSVVLGRRIKGRFQKHWIKVQGVQERAETILTRANKANLSKTLEYFMEKGLHQEELYLLNKYFEFVVELKTRKTYDYQTVSKYAYELGDKIKGYIK